MALKSSIRWTPAVAGLALGLVFQGPATAQEPRAKLSIEARLFGSKSGELSGDVFGSDPPFLGNVVIQDDPSNSTFVTVKVSPEGKLGENARVRLIATETSRADGPQKPSIGLRRILDRAIPLPFIRDGQTEAYVAFWLDATGCAPIALTAELADPPRRKATTAATIDFRCYE